MTNRGFHALVRKDIIEGLRVGVTNVVLSVMMSFGMASVGVIHSTRLLAQEGVGSTVFHGAVARAAAGMYIPYFPIIIMMFAGNSIMQNLMYREKAHKTIIPVLCSGVTPGAVWAAKVLSVFAITYASSLLTMLLFCCVLSLFLKGIYIPAASVAIAGMLSAPLLSLVSIAVVGLIHMLFLRAWPASLILTILPVGLLPYWHKIAAFQLRSNTIVPWCALCLGAFGLIGLAATRVPRERLSGVLDWD